MMERSLDAEDILASLRRSIHSQLPWEELKTKLQVIRQRDLELEDENGFDILHHAIVANSAEVVHYLLLRGYFRELQGPAKIPYLHLTCFHGHATILNILLQERPYEPPQGEPHRVDFEQVPTSDNIGGQSLALLKNYSPLDLAAASKQIRCVQLLLSGAHQYGSTLERAVIQGSAECVKLLLREDKSIDQTDRNKAFKLALIRKFARCLEVLLNEGIQVDQVLNGMNPYHVMYMYSSGFQLHPIRNEGLAECTDILIRNGQNVNPSYPNGSYPLYSLIHSMMEEKDYDPSRMPVSHMKALESLLKAGADPNLDEDFLAQCKKSKSDFLYSLGRDTFTSALNALFVATEQSGNWNTQSSECLMSCLEILLEYGANSSCLNRYGNSPLHDLMKSMAVLHAQERYTNLLDPVFALLKYGGDLNIAENSGSMFPLVPVSYYFRELLRFTFTNGQFSFPKWCDSHCSSQVAQLLLYMDQSKAHAAYDMITTYFNTHPDRNIAETSHKLILPLMVDNVFQPRKLLSISTATVWKSIGCNYKNINRIPVPKLIKNIMYEMFNY